MSDLSKGYTFSGTSPNNTVTAEKLNTLVDQASIQPGFYTERPETTSGLDNDYLLLYQASSSSFRKIRKGNLITSGVAKTSFTNLVIANSPAAPESRLSVSADELVLRSVTGLARYVSGFSRTVDIETYSGASTPDGRDFATEAADAWYYVWAVSNGSDDRLLLSTSRTSPVLPADHLYRALLGAVRNDHGKDFVPFVQRNCDVAVQLASKAGISSPYLNPKTGLVPVEFTDVSCDTAGTFQAADLSSCIPPHLTASVSGLLGTTFATGGTSYLYTVATRGAGPANGNNTPAAAVGCQLLAAYVAASTTPMLGFYAAAPFHVPVQESQTIYWSVNTGTLRHNLRVHGYTLAL